MRMLLHVIFPIEPFNTATRNGTAGDTIGRILAETKPEAAYFTDHDGQRGATLVVQVNDASQIPALAEPWYLNFNADCQFRIAMTPDDLQRADLSELAKTWG